MPRFKPGQFLHLALDAYEPGGFWPDSRVFSIASSPRERDRLAITYAVKGAFTSQDGSASSSEGREVWVKLPYGEFVVDASRDAVLFAGGTGVTAFTAFLQSLEAETAPRVLLFYGARTPELFIYGPLAEACAREVPSLACTLVPEAVGRGPRRRLGLAGDREARRAALLPERPAADADRAHRATRRSAASRGEDPHRCLGVRLGRCPPRISSRSFTQHARCLGGARGARVSS